ncbi:MAG: efflux RND transporter periplasmic adaptor subunit [Anaerolineae bacterium]|nr:efflux RND transporter periplasmic adaptor subunit [Anaerolineae bacterium]
MMSRLRSLLLLLVMTMTVVVAGCSSTTVSGGSQPTPTPIPPPPVPEKPTYTVRRGEVVDSLSFTGRVAPVVEEELFFRENGRVKKVYVERDDMVEAGTLLAELENDDLMRQLAQAQIELEAAELNLSLSEEDRQYEIDKAQINLNVKDMQFAKAEAGLNSLELDVEVARINLAQALEGPSPEEIEIAERRVEQAKNSLWATQLRRDDVCGRDKGLDCDSAQANVQRSEEDVRIAQINLEELKKGPDAENIALQRIKLAQAEQRLAQAKMDLDILNEQSKLTSMEMAKLTQEADPQLTKAVQRSRLSVERLEAQLADTIVASPIEGKVTSVSAYDGREIQAFRPVFVVADEAELEVTAEPMSSQLQRLAEGMQAAVILSAYPGKELSAQIIQLPYPYGRGGGANIEEADKLTHISFDPEDLDIGPGDLVKVIVVLEEKPDALWLPPAAIRTFAGRKFVVVEEEGRQRRVDITVGIESAERVEITEGLEEGEVVVGQ